MSADEDSKTSLKKKPAYVKPTIATLKVNLSFASAPSPDFPEKAEDQWFDGFVDRFLHKRNKKAQGKGA